MSAIQRNRISSSVAGLFVVAVSAALLLGAAGGYAVRGAAHSTTGMTQLQNAPTVSVSKEPAELPAWVQGYSAHSEAARFKVDDLIAAHDYAAAAAATNQSASSPTSGQRGPTERWPQFKIDEVNVSLG